MFKNDSFLHYQYEYIYGYVLFDKDMRDIGSILTSESGKKHFIRWKKIISALHKEEEEEEKEEQEEPERQVPEKGGLLLKPILNNSSFTKFAFRTLRRE